MSFELTTKQRKALLDKEHPHIPLSVEEAEKLEPGQVIVLKQGFVWVTLLGSAKDKRKGLYLRYSVRDDRPRLLRSSPHNIDFGDMRRRLDNYGTPRAVSEQDAEEASESSGYTDSSYQALEDAGEAVPLEYQNVLTMRAKGRQVERINSERAEDVAKQQARQINESIRDVLLRRARMGLPMNTPAMADLHRAMERLRGEAEMPDAA